MNYHYPTPTISGSFDYTSTQLSDSSWQFTLPGGVLRVDIATHEWDIGTYPVDYTATFTSGSAGNYNLTLSPSYLTIKSNPGQE